MRSQSYRQQIRLSGRARELQRRSISNEPGLSRRKQFSAACLNRLRALKELVTKRLAEEYGNSLSATLLRQAIHEADALAATTLFPDLFLPILAEEKARSAYLWNTRQQQIQKETLSFAT